MYVITFYSFKGGVGRTMALVNVAAELVRRGRKVLVVDFDLEAPGLETYKQLRPPKPHPGIVEYVTEYRQTNQVPNLRDYIYETKPIGKKGGRLWVMPAGRRDSVYRTALSKLDWHRLYKDEEGFLLFEDTKMGWEMGWEQELKPDYVLIDSRTGDTDVLGICTRQLPDAVVLMFTPNEQNLVGLKNVCQDIRREKEEGLKKGIRLHFVAANVPDLDDEDRRLRRNLTQFRHELGIESNALVPVIHRNETLQMLDQPVFVLERPRSRLAGEYRSLVRMLQFENPEDRDGALQYLSDLEKGSSAWKGHVAPEDADRVNEITAQFWSDAEVILRAGQYLSRNNESVMAMKRLNRVLELQPDFGDALFERAFCHRLQRNDAAAAEDLLRYLRDHATAKLCGFPSNSQLLARQKNEVAYLELLAISLDEFLKLFDLPPVAVSQGKDSHDGFWLLTQISSRLIQEQRWGDAIRFLEHVRVKGLIESGNQLVATWIPFHAFLLAIAQWGKTGEPRREYCSKAILAYGPIVDCFDDLWTQGIDEDPYQYFRFYGSWFQDLALLYWGAGDRQKAADALDKAGAVLNKTANPGDLYVDPGVSSWTFQHTTVLEYRSHLDQMRRMIQGEPIRPPFLGPPAR